MVAYYGIEGSSLKKKYKITDIYVVVYSIISFLVYFITWFNIDMYNFSINYLNGFMLVLNLILSLMLFPKIVSKKGIDIYILFCLVIIVLINAIFSNSGIGSIIVIINMILMVTNFKHIVVTKKIIEFISFGMFMFLIYYIYVLPDNFNTNSVGYIILLSTIYTNIFLLSRKKLKILIPIVILVSVNAVLLTESRGALVGIIFFFIFSYVIPIKMIGSKRLIKILFLLLSLGSILFTLLYVYMYRNNINLNLPFINKPLYSGRELIWSELLNKYSEHPFIGIGSNYQITSYQVLNIHNSMLNILVIYGTAVFALFVIILGSRLINLSTFVSLNNQIKISLAGFLSLLCVGFFETNLLTASNIFPAYFLLVVGFSLSNSKNIK